MSEEEPSGETNTIDPQVLELQQKLSIAQEELETVRAGRDKQIQEASQTVEQGVGIRLHFIQYDP